MTPCAPINKQRIGADWSESEFAGAICYDIDPSGPLDEYFVFDASDFPFQMLFQSDEIFESRENLEQSAFKEYAEQIIGGQIKQVKQVSKVLVQSIKIIEKNAVLYNQQGFTLGQIEFTLLDAEDSPVGD